MAYSEILGQNEVHGKIRLFSFHLPQCMRNTHTHTHIVICNISLFMLRTGTQRIPIKIQKVTTLDVHVHTLKKNILDKSEIV